MRSDQANLTGSALEHMVPGRADRGRAKELDKLQEMMVKLQRSSEANVQPRPSQTESTLMQCAREVIVKGTIMYEASLAAESVAGGQGAASSNVRVAEWVSTLESIRRDQRLSDPSDMVSTVPSVFSGDEAHTVETRATSAQRAGPERGAVDGLWDGSEDDLDADLAKAALDTGTKAFEEHEWEEADSLLQEALRVLQQLPKQQRAFCDVFGLQYKLAVCAYHTQEPADAEEALMSLVQQSASSDGQRRYMYDAAHLLSLLYIRMGQVDRARFECEKALQARRRLLGKWSDAALESTALMAHIYVLLNNRARAKSCLAMIPEARREAVIQMVEESLGTNVGRPSPSPLAPPMQNRCYGPVSAMISQSPAATLPQPPAASLPQSRAASLPQSPAVSLPQSPAASPPPSYQHTQSNQVGSDDLRSMTVISLSLAEERSESRATEKERATEDYCSGPESTEPGEPPAANANFKGKTLSRKEILDKMGCKPKDRIEEAVCDGNHLAFASLLDRRKDFWRSKLRKRVRPERVTALHFAALFGEIDMARRLLGSNFNINEVPYGYTTNLTPLKFAIGARQVDMVEFLIANGAKPSEPDSWSTLAGQLMNRSWLMKTMSEAEKEDVPNRIIAILNILLQQGWNVNAPFETSGATVLHQAVTFWTGSYRWDLNLRAAVTSFLCDRGADPFRANTAGKTPYGMALSSGHQDLLLVLEQASRKNTPVELPGEL